MSEPMQARYRVTERDYVQSARVHTRLTRRGWTVLALVLLASALGLALWGQPGMGSVLAGGAVGGVVAWCGIQFVLNPWLLRRHYRQYKLIQQEQRVALHAEGVDFESDNGRTQLTWDKVLKWRHSPDYVLIYPMPRLYHLVPGTVAAQGFDIERLKAALAQHVGPAV